MPSIDPGQLLKALSPLLLPTGAMRGTVEASRIVSLMKDANKLVSKCLYLNIVKSTESEEVLQKFLTVGGWDTLNKWLQQARDDENAPLLVELLKVYQGLPVTVEDLKKDNTARSIKSLTKHQNEGVKSLSSSVVDSWMKKVKGKGTNEADNDKLKKKKKKDKDRDRERDKEKDSSRDKEKDKDRERDKEKDSSRDKEKDKDRHRHSKSSDKKDSSHNSSKKDSIRKDSTEKNLSSSSADTGDSEVQSNTSEQLQDRLSGDSGADKDKVKTNSSGKEEEEEEKTRRKPKTARVFTNKFRSVFDEDDDPLPPIKKKTPEELKGSLPLPKRSSTDIKEEPPEKIPRLTLKMPPLMPDGTSSGTSPTNTSPPEVTHGRIKIIPPKRPPAHEIHESNVFMNELTKSTYTHGTIKRKKKPSAVTTTGGSTKQPGIKSPTTTTPTTPTTPGTPTTPSSPVSPMTAMAQKLPSVPSFYRDTLESTDDAETAQEQKEPSPPPLEKMDAEDTTQQNNVDENEEPPSIDMEVKEEDRGNSGDVRAEAGADGERKVSIDSEAAGENKENSEDEPRGLLTTATPAKKNRKRVSWAEEANLRQIHYFELDETERENVNRPKTFNEMKKQEMRLEGRAMESAKRLISDNMVEVLPWRRPPVIDNLVVAVELGCNSKEREIQQQRESGVLQALFFSKQMLPDSPSEPDLESVEPAETKIIPLEDETSSAEEYEHTYNVDPAAMPYDPAFDISQNLGNVGPGAAGNGGGGGNGAGGGMGGIQLPPDLSNILASIQQQSIATGGQSLQANSAVMANVQSILSSIMHGGPGANSEELINKLRVALDPLKNQISAPVPAMTPQDPGQQFPPQGPQRHGLLGNAPPGFTPMMGGPRPFGPPQGPGMGRGMEGEGWNMGMGPGPMGPGFHPMPGPMNMGGPRPRGPPMRGPRRGQRAVCRHFVAPGGCRFGNACGFLHPGVNGPPLN